MNATELQQWLNTHGAQVAIDGNPGPQTRAAILSVFASNCAPAITAADIATLATRLGCQPKQIKAITQVESGGAAFDKDGRPKILFERHLFHRLTKGKHGVSAWGNPKGGGYNENSWNKLAMAACQDVDAAFGAVSWGKFQVLGLHWKALDYPSPIEMAYSTVTSEVAHYEMFARYLEKNNLVKAARKISTNAADNVAFAKGYNGPAFKRFSYDTKIARAMA